MEKYPIWGEPGEEERNYSFHLIKARKEHPCCNCEIGITKGQFCLLEKCVIPDEGWKNAYTCMPCLDKWMEEFSCLKSNEGG